LWGGQGGKVTNPSTSSGQERCKMLQNFAKLIQNVAKHAQNGAFFIPNVAKFCIILNRHKEAQKDTKKLPKIAQINTDFLVLTGGEKEFRIWVPCSWPREYHSGIFASLRG